MTYGDLPRIAWLASEANPDRRSREAYARLADRPYMPPEPSASPAELDAGDRPTAAESIALLKSARECPHRAVPACSCAFARCLKDERDKSAARCIECVRAEPTTPVTLGSGTSR